MERSASIIRTSAVGIAVNLLLSAFKAAVGYISGSIAITLDAVNNLSDALSSVITIIGAILAGKKPDRDHPFGHGRTEYISASAISFIVLYAGISALVESVRKIVTPRRPEYTVPGLIVIAAAVGVKLLLGRYFIRKGRAVGSDSLTASGKDAALDAAVSLSTLAAAVIFMLYGISLEAWLGALISLLMIRSGCGMLRETISRILGERPLGEKTAQIKAAIMAFPEVHGVYDLVLHNYGPDMLIGSAHIEVDDVMTADRIDLLERSIGAKVLESCGVVLEGLSIYARNTRNEEHAAAQRDIASRVLAHEHVLQLHGFYMNDEYKELRFDVVIALDAPDRQGLFLRIEDEIKAAYPGYTVSANLDADMSDI